MISLVKKYLILSTATLQCLAKSLNIYSPPSTHESHILQSDNNNVEETKTLKKVNVETKMVFDDTFEQNRFLQSNEASGSQAIDNQNESEEQEGTRTIIIVVSCIAGLLILFGLISFFMYKRIIRRRKQKELENLRLQSQLSHPNNLPTQLIMRTEFNSSEQQQNQILVQSENQLAAQNDNNLEQQQLENPVISEDIVMQISQAPQDINIAPQPLPPMLQIEQPFYVQNNPQILMNPNPDMRPSTEDEMIWAQIQEELDIMMAIELQHQEEIEEEEVVQNRRVVFNIMQADIQEQDQAQEWRRQFEQNNRRRIQQQEMDNFRMREEERKQFQLHISKQKQEERKQQSVEVLIKGQQECVICLEELVNVQNKVSKTDCSHFFHIDCLNSWMQNKQTCPSCRAKVQPNNIKEINITSNMIQP